MGSLRMRLEQHVASARPSLEPGVMAATIIMSWPPAATEADVDSLLRVLCESAVRRFRDKQQESA